MARLFVALRVPRPCRSGLFAGHREMEGVRWTKPEQLHLTIRFIGEADAEPIEAQLRTIESPPVEFVLGDVALLPSRGNPRVIAATARSSPSLEALHIRVSNALAAVGIGGERRPFRPHVTLARCKELDSRDLANLLRTLDIRETACVVDHFELVESELRADGARHVVRASFPLG